MNKNSEKFCRFVDNEIGKFAEEIVQDFMEGKIDDDPTDSFWWPYFGSFRLIRKVLKDYGLWDKGEQF